MEPEQLFDYMKKQVEKVSGMVNLSMMGMGFAIPIPQEATGEAKAYVDGELADLAWDFHRCVIGPEEYYVLFPL